MAQVYGWMTVGLLLTAFVAWYAANSAAVMELLFTNRVFLIGLIIAQLALVIVLSAMIQKLSAGVTTMLFMLYSALTGLTLSSIFIVYTAAFLSPVLSSLLPGCSAQSACTVTPRSAI